MFTVGSLFSGIGGIDLGLERAGFKIAWQVEIDEYCQKVLAKHWPNVARYGDIRTVGKHNLAPVDLICGGFPCQDISIAGKRAGITGERSGLWSEFYRIICELRPSFVLVENVSALLYGGIDRVLGDLATSGYDAEWQIISAEAFGAPHLRERVFIVGYSLRQRCGGQGLQYDTRKIASQGSQNGDTVAYTNSTERRQITQRRHVSNGDNTRWQETSSRPTLLRKHGGARQVANPDRQSLAVGQVFGSYARQELTAFKRDCSEGAGQWAVEPRLDRVVNGVPYRVDRLRGLGNSVVPQVAEYVGRCILASIG